MRARCGYLTTDCILLRSVYSYTLLQAAADLVLFYKGVLEAPLALVKTYPQPSDLLQQRIQTSH